VEQPGAGAGRCGSGVPLLHADLEQPLLYASFAEYQSLRNQNPGNDATLGWAFESIAFYTVLPIDVDHCAAGYFPIYRAYNKRFPELDSNHRITPSYVDYVRSVYFLGYADEHVAFCSPAMSEASSDLHAWYAYPGAEVEAGGLVEALFIFSNNGPGSGNGGRVHISLPPKSSTGSTFACPRQAPIVHRCSPWMPCARDRRSITGPRAESSSPTSPAPPGRWHDDEIRWSDDSGQRRPRRESREQHATDRAHAGQGRAGMQRGSQPDHDIARTGVAAGSGVLGPGQRPERLAVSVVGGRQRRPMAVGESLERHRQRRGDIDAPPNPTGDCAAAER
jgi:hypothetical protein